MFKKKQQKCEKCKVYFDLSDLQVIPIFAEAGMDSFMSGYRYFCPQHQTKAQFGVKTTSGWGRFSEPAFYEIKISKLK